MSAITSKLSAQINYAERIIQTESDLHKSLKIAFSLFGELAKDIPPKPYFEIHSQFMLFFEILLHRISILKQESSDSFLDETFNLVLSHERIVPRLYNAIIFACGINNQEYIDLITKMLPAVSHPLRGFMLRYTFIFLYPKYSPTLKEFALSNFSEMLKSIELIHFQPNLIPDAPLQWLNTNITISLSGSNFSQKLLRSYFDQASQVKNETIKLSIILSIIQILSYPNLVMALPNFTSLFRSFSINDNTNNAAILFCSLLKNPSESFDFASKTPFSSICSEKATQCALLNSDYGIVKNCIIEWPNENILDMIYQSIGTEKMIHVLPPSFKLPTLFLLKLIDNVQQDIDKETVRKLILTIHFSHSVEIEDAIVRMIYRNKYDENTITFIFEPPFIYESTQQDSPNQYDYSNLTRVNDSLAHQIKENEGSSNENDHSKITQLKLDSSLDTVTESQFSELTLSSEKINESGQELENIPSDVSIVIEKPILSKRHISDYIEITNQPFTFKTSHLFQLVIMAMAQSNVDFRTIHYYINSSLQPDSLIDQNVSLCVLCSVWPSGHSEDFVNLLRKIHSVTQDDLCMICNAFERLQIDNKDIEYFTSQCKSKDALMSLLRYLISTTDENAIEKTIIRIFELDGILAGVVERLKLYFEVLNIVAEIKNDISINSDIFQTIFEIILQIIQFTRRFPMFIIDSNVNTSERFLKCLRNYASIKIFKNFHDKINMIIELYTHS